jgi:hypothetical protein
MVANHQRAPVGRQRHVMRLAEYRHRADELMGVDVDLVDRGAVGIDDEGDLEMLRRRRPREHANRQRGNGQNR